MQFERK
jgi:hypothetical protein